MHMNALNNATARLYAYSYASPSPVRFTTSGAAPSAATAAPPSPAMLDELRGGALAAGLNMNDILLATA